MFDNVLTEKNAAGTEGRLTEPPIRVIMLP